MKLRFTIRDLLWLAVVVALAVGWWMDRGRLALELTGLRQRVDDLERSNNILWLDRATNLSKQATQGPPASGDIPQSAAK